MSGPTEESADTSRQEETDSAWWKEFLGEYAQEIYFDPESMTFVSSDGERTTVEQLAQSELGIMELYSFTKQEARKVDIETALLVVMHGEDIRALPNLREWLKGVKADEQKYQTIWSDTIKIMRSVMKIARPDLKLPSAKADNKTHFNFNMSIRDEGEIILGVLGDCACLGPNPSGYEGWGDNSDQPTTYCLHNIDYPAQAIALYAGMGYLASVAAQEIYPTVK